MPLISVFILLHCQSRTLDVVNVRLILFSETQIFVDKLFEAVNAKSYLPQPEQLTSTSRTEPHQRTEKDESKREEVKKKKQDQISP